MSLQVFLQARLTGIERFLADSGGELELRVRWLSLFSEVLPRALLAELGLSRMLLGTSAGEQFLLVIPIEFRPQAEEFLDRVNQALDARSAGALRIVWAATENLGDWSDIRKRLQEQWVQRFGTPAAAGPALFAEAAADPSQPLFDADSVAAVHEAGSIGWSPDAPLTLRTSGGKHVWAQEGDDSGLGMVRHTALRDDGAGPASLPELAARAAGRRTWGVLRGDVDSFESRLHRAVTVEEHLQLSIMYKQFFAGEIQVLCSMPEFFRTVSVLYSGGDDFALVGSWNALILFARELQRLFHRFVDANLRELAGPEGKTITMAIALARGADDCLGSVYRTCGDYLEVARASGKDCIHLLGRTLEWKQLSDAGEMKDTMARMVSEFGCSAQFLHELAGFYRPDTPADGRRTRSRNDRLERPWRFHRRLNRVIRTSAAMARNREFQKVRADLISDFTGRNAAQIRLRPAGRVALEWARLETESGGSAA